MPEQRLNHSPSAAVGHNFAKGVKKAPTLARTGGLVPKKALVASNAMPSISPMPEMTQQVGKSLGDWKTIDQRERQASGARRQRRHGAGNIFLGGAATLYAHSNDRGAVRHAVQAGRNMGGKDRPVYMRGLSSVDGPSRDGGVARVPWRDADESLLTGLSRRARYARTITRKAPHTAIAGGGMLLAGYGATQMARGRVKEGYQQRRINARRRDNAARATSAKTPAFGKAEQFDNLEAAYRGVRRERMLRTAGTGAVMGTAVGLPVGVHTYRRQRRKQQGAFGKADRYYDPEDRRQRRVGAYGVGGGLVGGRVAYTAARDIHRDTKHVQDLPHDFARSREPGGASGGGRWAKVIRDQKDRENKAVQFVRGAGHKLDKPLLVRPSRAGRLGGGLALVGGSYALVRRGNDPRRRRWS